MRDVNPFYGNTIEREYRQEIGNAFFKAYGIHVHQAQNPTIEYQAQGIPEPSDSQKMKIANSALDECLKNF